MDDRPDHKMSGWRFELWRSRCKCNKGQGETILCFAEWFTNCPSGHAHSHSVMSRSELLKLFKIVWKKESCEGESNNRFLGTGEPFWGLTN